MVFNLRGIKAKFSFIDKNKKDKKVKKAVEKDDGSVICLGYTFTSEFHTTYIAPTDLKLVGSSSKSQKIKYGKPMTNRPQLNLQTFTQSTPNLNKLIDDEKESIPTPLPRTRSFLSLSNEAPIPNPRSILKIEDEYKSTLILMTENHESDIIENANGASSRTVTFDDTTKTIKRTVSFGDDLVVIDQIEDNFDDKSSQSVDFIVDNKANSEDSYIDFAKSVYNYDDTNHANQDDINLANQDDKNHANQDNINLPNQVDTKHAKQEDAFVEEIEENLKLIENTNPEIAVVENANLFEKNMNIQENINMNSKNIAENVVLENNVVLETNLDEDIGDKTEENVADAVEMPTFNSYNDYEQFMKSRLVDKEMFAGTNNITYSDTESEGSADEEYEKAETLSEADDENDEEEDTEEYSSPVSIFFTGNEPIPAPRGRNPKFDEDDNVPKPVKVKKRNRKFDEDTISYTSQTSA